MKIRQNGAAVQLEDKKMTTLIPVKIKWHGGRKKVIPAATVPDQQPEHDASMLVALSRAYHWQRLIDTGAVESQGRGKGVRYFLSRELFAAIGTPGAYTRRKGLDHETNKALLMRHLWDNAESGAPKSELTQVLPSLSGRSISRLMDELRREGYAEIRGERRGARWFPLRRYVPSDPVSGT